MPRSTNSPRPQRPQRPPRPQRRTAPARRGPAWPALALVLAATLGAAPAALGQCEPVRVVSPSGPDADWFGQVLGADAAPGGDQWFIGEQDRVWTYTLAGGSLVPEQMLELPHGYRPGSLGARVSAEGDRLVVSSAAVTWPGRDRPAGGAFVFERVEGQWARNADLEPPAEFGGSIGSNTIIDGDSILMGGYAAFNRVLVWRPSAVEPGAWELVQHIDPPADLPAGSDFGFPMAARDGWLFVGATRDDTLARLAGSVLVYRRGPDGLYERVQKIEGALAGEYKIWIFGEAIAFDGRTLAIGSQWASPELDEQGAAYVYELEGDRWALKQTLTHSGARAGHKFGPAIAVDGDRMTVLAFRDRTERSDMAVYAFERTARGLWRQSARLLPITPRHAASFGASMSLDGDRALIGAYRECEPGGSDQTGAAYLFDLSCYECPDLDADDRLTVFDYLEFMRAFDAGEPIADMDNDGTLTIADFLAFQDAFAAGCP